MKYRANKVADLFGQVKKGNSYVDIPNMTEFSIPDVGFGSTEMNGAGMIGPVNVPDKCNIESMEVSIKTTSDHGDAKLLSDPDGVEVILNWAIDKIGTDGSSEYIAYRAVIKGWATVVPGGERKKGEVAECEHKISPWYYQLDINGRTAVLVDKFAPKLVINGEDRLEKLNKALNR